MGSATSKPDLCEACQGTGLKNAATHCPECKGTPSAKERARLAKLEDAPAADETAADGEDSEDNKPAE